MADSLKLDRELYRKIKSMPVLQIDTTVRIIFYTDIYQIIFVRKTS